MPACIGAAPTPPTPPTGLDAKFDECQLIPAADGFDSTSAQKDHCHLPNIQKATGAAFSEMLFFDDELGNIAKGERQEAWACDDACPVRLPRVR